MAINVSVQHNGGFLPENILFKKNLNASKPSEHPPSGGKLSKDLGGNIDCTKTLKVSKGFSNVVTSGQHYNITRCPQLYFTLTLIAIHGHQTKQNKNIIL